MSCYTTPTFVTLINVLSTHPECQQHCWLLKSLLLQTLNRLKFIDPLSRINFDQNVNNNVWNCSTILYILNNLKRWQYNHIFGGCIYVSCSLGETWVNVISIGFKGQVVPILSSYFIYSFYCRYKKTKEALLNIYI